MQSLLLWGEVHSGQSHAFPRVTDDQTRGWGWGWESGVWNGDWSSGRKQWPSADVNIIACWSVGPSADSVFCLGNFHRFKQFQRSLCRLCRCWARSASCTLQASAELFQLWCKHVSKEQKTERSAKTLSNTWAAGCFHARCWVGEKEKKKNR